MRFKRGRSVYPLPKTCVNVLRTFIHIGRHVIALERVMPSYIDEMRAHSGKPWAVPQYFCIGKTDRVIEFYPPPNKAWRFTVDYLVRRTI